MIKRFFCQLILFVSLCVLPSMAFAETDKVIIDEAMAVDLNSIQTIAVMTPQYSPLPIEPTKEEIENNLKVCGDKIFARVNKKNSTKKILSYDEVAEKILADTKQDIRTMDRRLAARLYRHQIKNYADAFVVLTVANHDPESTYCFFELYQANGSSAPFFSYRIQAGRFDDNDLRKRYRSFTEKFYEAFNMACKNQNKK